MNALNEINKVISSVSYYTHRHGNPEEEDWLTAERMAVSPFDSSFMNENLLKENEHQFILEATITKTNCEIGRLIHDY